jgi:hypothetical protein
MMICQALPDEIFALVSHLGFQGEADFAGIEDGLISDERHL